MADLRKALSSLAVIHWQFDFKCADVTWLFQCNTTTQYDLTYSNTQRGAQGKQPLCTDLQRTTLDVVNYKTYSDTTNQFSSP